MKRVRGNSSEGIVLEGVRNETNARWSVVLLLTRKGLNSSSALVTIGVWSTQSEAGSQVQESCTISSFREDVRQIVGGRDPDDL